LVTLPSFSKEPTAGRRKTSVFILVGSAPGRFQKLAVSVCHMSATTIQSSLSMARLSRLASGPPTAGFWPQTISPLMLPASMASNRAIWE
jgi:hypothetical protein